MELRFARRLCKAAQYCRIISESIGWQHPRVESSRALRATVLGAPVLWRVARRVPVVPHATVDLVTPRARLVCVLCVETM